MTKLTVLPFLDPTIVAANPKPFVGYSDNTNLLNWLWNLGVVSYHGGSTMVHLGRGGGVHPVSADSLRAALFTRGDLALYPVDVFSEDELDWNDATSLGKPAPTLAAPGWSWHQPDRVVTAPTWGGNLEILHWNLAANRWIRPVDDYAGCVLLLETLRGNAIGHRRIPDAARRRRAWAAGAFRPSWSAPPKPAA
jgi:muramoyltetrapeptide carboxypeptidase LdcA involved in peptidoglycan recycling